MPCLETIGLIINPIAGMGGRVGLKGTDGLYDRARALGAEPAALQRAVEALHPLAGRQLRFLTAAGEMGETALAAAGITGFSIVYQPSDPTTARDTKAACRAFLGEGIDLLLFCGGDGTARDVADVVGQAVPILGIPAGVKMFSSVFAVDPAAIEAVIPEEGPLRCIDAEVIDVDEEAYRSNEFRTVLHAMVRTPAAPGFVQASKQVFEEADEERARSAIGAFIADAMLPGILYILGPGTTTDAVARRLGLRGTLLGFDAVLDGKVVGTDLDERGILGLLGSAEEARLVLSVIGAQGFVLGRGTQVCTPAVLHHIGLENLILLGTPGKLARTPALHVDTSDPKLDAAFGPHLLIVTGYGTAQRKRRAIHAVPPSG
ncbi:ATP-NAD kinase [anaerobic digester metagenome]